MLADQLTELRQKVLRPRLPRVFRRPASLTLVVLGIAATACDLPFTKTETISFDKTITACVTRERFNPSVDLGARGRSSDHHALTITSESLGEKIIRSQGEKAAEARDLFDPRDRVSVTIGVSDKFVVPINRFRANQLMQERLTTFINQPEWPTSEYGKSVTIDLVQKGGC